MFREYQHDDDPNTLSLNPHNTLRSSPQSKTHLNHSLQQREVWILFLRELYERELLPRYSLEQYHDPPHQPTQPTTDK